MTNVILNLTQHPASAEQKEAGVIDLTPDFQRKLKELLTFEQLPTCEKIKYRVSGICELVVDFCLHPNSPIKDEVRNLILDKDGEVDEVEFKKLDLKFMIGGAPFLMGPLESELSYMGKVYYAFSKRVVEETTGPDGSVVKKTIFRHEGFVPACLNYR